MRVDLIGKHLVLLLADKLHLVENSLGISFTLGVSPKCRLRLFDPCIDVGIVVNRSSLAIKVIQFSLLLAELIFRFSLLNDELGASSFLGFKLCNLSINVCKIGSDRNCITLDRSLALGNFSFSISNRLLSILLLLAKGLAFSLVTLKLSGHRPESVLKFLDSGILALLPVSLCLLDLSLRDHLTASRAFVSVLEFGLLDVFKFGRKPLHECVSIEVHLVKIRARRLDAIEFPLGIQKCVVCRIQSLMSLPLVLQSLSVSIVKNLVFADI